MRSGRTTITLSGIVGAGKSTAAKAIVQALRAAGCQAEHVRFQELTHGLRLARPRPVAPPDADMPAAAVREEGKRWRGYRRRKLGPGTAAGYAVRTLLFRSRLRRWPKDTVLVFDRYFYDSLAHFDLQAAGMPLTLLMKTIPPPTIAALLLIRDTTMLERRSRYSADYAGQVAQGYEALLDRFPGLLVARTDDFSSVTHVASRIVAEVLTRMGRTDARVGS